MHAMFIPTAKSSITNIFGETDRYRKRSTSTVFCEDVGNIYQVVWVHLVADGRTDMTELTGGFETRVSKCLVVC